MSYISNNYEQVIPAASNTWAAVRRTPGDPITVHPVVAWARLYDSSFEALIHVNETGRLTSVVDLEETCYAVSVFNTFRDDDPDPMAVARHRERQTSETED